MCMCIGRDSSPIPVLAVDWAPWPAVRCVPFVPRVYYVCLQFLGDGIVKRGFSRSVYFINMLEELK